MGSKEPDACRLTILREYDKISGKMTWRIWKRLAANRKLIFVTFEIFWIIVFLLGQVSNSNSVDIPQFIYVNF
jgi:hypothetical protein